MDRHPLLWSSFIGKGILICSKAISGVFCFYLILLNYQSTSYANGVNLGGVVIVEPPYFTKLINEHK